MVRAVVQARLSSTRLPGKVLADVDGEPMLGLLLKRLGRASTVDEIVVATSTDRSDDPLAAFCADHDVQCYRGPLDDVLARFAGAIDGFTGTVVRITADCPLVDPELVDEVVELLHASPGAVYASNIEPRVFPDGLDVEAVRANVLRGVSSRIHGPGADRFPPEYREHVTLAIRSDKEYRRATPPIVTSPDLGALRWTVDEPADLEFIRATVASLGARKYLAGWREVLAATS